jgi:hypothetical protein
MDLIVSEVREAVKLPSIESTVQPNQYCLPQKFRAPRHVLVIVGSEPLIIHIHLYEAGMALGRILGPGKTQPLLV